MKVLLCLSLAGAALAGEYAILDNGFRIRAEGHETAGDLVRLMTTHGVIELPAASVVAFEAEDYVPPPSPPQLPEVAEKRAVDRHPRQLIEEAAERYGLPPELLHSVAQVESGYQNEAVSPKGAIGVMQLMPATAEKLNANPYDPAQNVDAGARHLRDLLVKYGGGAYRALAAYNAGAGAVDRYDWIPPYRETQSYVRKVLERYQKLSSLKGKPARD